MTTANASPILNLSNLVASPNAAPKQNSNLSPEHSFNSVLSREISDRQPAPPPAPKAREAEKPQASKAPTPAPAPTPAQAAPASSDKSNNANSANGSNNTDNGDSGDNAPATAAKGKDDADSDSATDAAQNAAAAAQGGPTAELLALVASFNQPAVKADPRALATDADSKDLGIANDPHASGKSGKAALASATASPALLGKAKADADAAPVDPKDAFASALETGKAATAALGKTDGDAAAITGAGTAKIDDGLTETKPQATLPTLTGKKAEAPSDPLAAAAQPAAAKPELAAALKGREISAEPPIAIKPQEAPVASTAIGPAQQSSLSVTQATLAQPVDKLSPPVGTQAWDQALGQKVVWLATAGQQSATLTLNPPDLGPLQVVLNVSNDQTNVSFTAAQPEARQALEAALPKLREMMSDAGIQLGNATVSTGLPNQQHNAPGEQQQQQRTGASRFDASNAQAEPAVRNVRSTAVGSGLGLVDTFA